MGCWNETCALTRLPIQASAPVVALKTVQGLPYKQASSGRESTDLLFGLPYTGAYDGYGGIENFENPDFVAFQQDAFEKNPYYRKIQYTSKFSGQASLFVIASEKPWCVSTEIFEHIFLMKDQVGILAQEKSRYQASDAEVSRRYKDNEAVRKELAKRFKEADFGSSYESVLGTFERIFNECFGEPYGILAYHLAKRKGLTISEGQILMHKSAYDAAVENFASRKVSKTVGKRNVAMTLRQYLSDALDELLVGLEQSRSKYAEMAAPYLEKLKEDPDNEEALDALKLTKLLEGSELRGNQFEALKPLTRPWIDEMLPLISHFWGTRQPKEILDVYGREPLLDFFVFQWARHYMRIDLTRSNGGSQNNEIDLMASVFQATIKAVTGGKKVRDFSPYLG